MTDSICLHITRISMQCYIVSHLRHTLSTNIEFWRFQANQSSWLNIFQTWSYMTISVRWSNSKIAMYTFVMFDKRWILPKFGWAGRRGSGFKMGSKYLKNRGFWVFWEGGVWLMVVYGQYEAFGEREFFRKWGPPRVSGLIFTSVLNSTKTQLPFSAKGVSRGLASGCIWSVWSFWWKRIFQKVGPPQGV